MAEEHAEGAARETTAIRDFAPGDIDRVAEFEAAIALRSFADEAVTDLAHYRKKLGKLLKYGDDWTKVIEKADGTVVGWAWVSSRQNFITGDLYADFRSFYVDPEAGGPGVAVGLLRELIRHCEAEGFTRIVGRTASSNQGMRALYRLAGFEERHVVYELDIGAPEGARRPLG